VPGGIFLPLLVMGGILGAIFGSIFINTLGIDSNILQNFIILGMAGFFAAIVRAPVTGIILISELTGNFSNFLTLSIVSMISYVVADLLRSKPIYDQLLSRLIKKIGNVTEHRAESVVTSPLNHLHLQKPKKSVK
jgi:H+/Cl- antiporter ClcA